MKKIIPLAASFTLLFACESFGDISFTDNRSATATASFEATDFETEGYYYTNSIGSVSYYVTVTNNSEATVSVKGTANGFDADGNVIAVKEMDIDVLGPGETSIGSFWFGDSVGIENVEYSLEYEKEPNYLPVLSNLSVVANVNDKNVTLSATNNGTYNAQFVEAYGLFFDADNNLIYVDSGYIVDDDSEIKAGDTISKQLNCNGLYTDLQIFLTGRSNGKISQKSDFDDTKMEIAEYKYENSYSTQYYVAVTNNSEQTVKISGNGLAKKADGSVIGAASLEIDVLAPGETSTGNFYFNGVHDVDHVEYKLSYKTDPYYKPVIDNLDVEVSINDKNVIAMITNNGTYAAQFVQAYCLFMDSEDNIVYATSNYIVDDDSEIKPGDTISGQINCSAAFDHIEMFLTGRAS